MRPGQGKSPLLCADDPKPHDRDHVEDPSAGSRSDRPPAQPGDLRGRHLWAAAETCTAADCRDPARTHLLHRQPGEMPVAGIAHCLLRRAGCGQRRPSRRGDPRHVADGAAADEQSRKPMDRRWQRRRHGAGNPARGDDASASGARALVRPGIRRPCRRPPPMADLAPGLEPGRIRRLRPTARRRRGGERRIRDRTRGLRMPYGSRSAQRPTLIGSARRCASSPAPWPNPPACYRPSSDPGTAAGTGAGRNLRQPGANTRFATIVADQRCADDGAGGPPIEITISPAVRPHRP